MHGTPAASNSYASEFTEPKFGAHAVVSPLALPTSAEGPPAAHRRTYSQGGRIHRKHKFVPLP